MPSINNLEIRNLKVVDFKTQFDLFIGNRRVGSTFLFGGSLPDKIDILPCEEIMFMDYHNYWDLSVTGVKAVILDLLLLIQLEADFYRSSVCGDDILGVFLKDDHQISLVQGFADYTDLENAKITGLTIGFVFMSIQDFIFKGVQSVAPNY
jgi:hypothetical protein